MLIRILFYFLLLLLLSKCNGNKFQKYEVRKIDININQEIKEALNFLSTNMDPLKEEDIDMGEFNLMRKKYFYFNITSNIKEIIIKEEFHRRYKEGSIIIDHISYIIFPIELLVPENIKIEIDALEQLAGRKTYLLAVEPLYKQDIKKIEFWYNYQDKKLGDKKENLCNDFYLSFGSDYEKSEKFASYFKKLCAIN